MNYMFLFIGLGFTALELIFKAWKLQKVVSLLRPLSFKDSLEIYLIGLPYGAVTPGKVGDVVKLFTLRNKTGLERTDCVALGLVERLLEMIALVGLAGVGVFVLVGHLSEQQFISLMACVMILFVGMIAVLNQKIVQTLLRPFFYLFMPKSKRDSSRTMFYQFYEGVRKMTANKNVMVVSLIFCVMGWLSGSIRTYYFAQGLGITSFTFVQCLFLIPLVTVIELIPISILGVGTRDYALISLFHLMGFAAIGLKEQAVSLSMLMLVVGGIPPALIGYVIALREHIRWKDIEDIKKEDDPGPQPPLPSQ